MTAKASRPPLAFCALKYLMQWMQRERDLHTAFAREASAEAFREALQYFRISRNFKGITDSRRLATARGLYLSTAACARGTPEELVEALAKGFEKRFGQYNVSAASKLLWLKHREPFVVMDARAVKGLRFLTAERLAGKDYTAYSRAWRHYYDAEHKKICAAADLLPRASEFLPANRLSRPALVGICSAEWFRERVLDIFLWEVGGQV